MSRWERAPIKELAVGIQFEVLASFNNGHLGAFWNRVRHDFPHCRDVMPRDVVVERFDKGPNFVAGPNPMIAESALDTRLQMFSADRTRMLQLQNGWLVVNWIRTDDASCLYPGYSDVLASLLAALNELQQFATDVGLGVIRPTIWELTYIDSIPAGTVWKSWEEIPAVFPGLLAQTDSQIGTFEAIGGRWSFGMPISGRLTIQLQSGIQPHVNTLQPVVLCTSTARGPIVNGVDIHETLLTAKSHLVRSFLLFTSKDAQGYWKGGI